MKTRILSALTTTLLIGTLLLAGTAPYDEPDIDSPSAFLSHGNLGITIALYLALVLVWIGLTLYQRRCNTACVAQDG